MNHRFPSGSLFLALVLGFAAFPSLGRAQNQHRPQLLIPAQSSEPGPAAVFQSTTPNDLFALSVASDAHTLLIGAPFGDSIKGEVHLYYQSLNGLEWREHQLLRPTSPTPTRLFGFSIALGNNSAAIATYHSPVFVFERIPLSDDWEQTAVIETPDDTSFQGDTMCMNEGVLAIGVSTFGAPVDEAGCVLIYEREPSRAWHFVTRVQAEDPQDSAFFGSSVALLGDYLVVGAPGAANDSGAVYVFKREGGTWHQVQKIVSPTPIPSGEFGNSVATNIGWIVIAEPGDGEVSNTPGRAFLYELGPVTQPEHWTLKHEFAPTVPLGPKSRFGHRVGIDGNNRNVLITQLRTAPTPDTQEPGSAYAFTIGPTGWEQRLRFAPTASEPASSFGISLAVASEHAVIGDYGTATKPGKAYLYDLKIPQSPPVFLDAPDDFRVNAAPGQSAEVTLEVTVADENGADLDVRWQLDGVEVQSDFVDGGVPFTQGTVSLTTTLAPGVHHFRVVADERSSDLEAVHTFTVTVGDVEGPNILSVTARPSTIPAQGRRFVLARLDVQATDPSSPVTWKITGVESSDPDPRPPRQAPDWIITPNQHGVRLRATTDKRKANRIYTIHVQASDGFGNTSTGQTIVTIIAERGR